MMLVPPILRYHGSITGYISRHGSKVTKHILLAFGTFCISPQLEYRLMVYIFSMEMPSLPSEMRAQQVFSNSGGIENGLHMATRPLPARKPDQHLVQVIASALNPGKSRL
jgi:hypothetical protein